MKRMIIGLLLGLVLVAAMPLQALAAPTNGYRPEWGDEFSVRINYLMTSNPSTIKNHPYAAVFYNKSTQKFLIIFASTRTMTSSTTYHVMDATRVKPSGSSSGGTSHSASGLRFTVNTSDMRITTTGFSTNNYTVHHMLPEFSTFIIPANQTTPTAGIATDSIHWDWYLYVLESGPVDTSTLEALLSQAEAITNTGYTAGSWSALQQAITDTRALLDRADLTQAEVDAQAAVLRSAMDGLALLPDTTALRAALAEAEAVTDKGYTASSWTRLQSAIAQAHALLAGTSYTQTQVDSATNALRSAMSGLLLLPTAPDLAARVTYARTIENTGYTEESWNALQAAIREAQSLLSGRDYTQAQLTAMDNQLMEAINNLQTGTITPPPDDGHRYLVDGFRVDDLMPWQDAVMGNLSFARTGGLSLLAIMAGIMLIPRILIRFAGGGSGYADRHEPTRRGKL